MSLIKITLLGCITKHCRVLKVIAYYLYLSFFRYSRIEKIFCTKMIKLKKHASRLQVHIYLKKKKHTHKQKMQRQIDCSYLSRWLNFRRVFRECASHRQHSNTYLTHNNVHGTQHIFSFRTI